MKLFFKHWYVEACLSGVKADHKLHSESTHTATTYAAFGPDRFNSQLDLILFFIFFIAFYLTLAPAAGPFGESFTARGDC